MYRRYWRVIPDVLVRCRKRYQKRVEKALAGTIEGTGGAKKGVLARSEEGTGVELRRCRQDT